MTAVRTTVAGATVVDFAVADYMQGLLGDDVSLERWSIDADAGDVHLLNVRVTMPVSALLDVVTRLAPRVTSFGVVVAEHQGAPGLAVSAAISINIVDLVKVMAGPVMKMEEE